MVPNKLAFAALAVACVAAAAGGGYVATRQNATPALEATSAAGPAEAAPPAAAVHETEAVVGDAPRENLPAVAPEPAEAPRAARPTPRAARETPPRQRPAPARPAENPASRPPAPPALDRTWPSSAAPAPAPAAPVGPVELPTAPAPPAAEDRTGPEPAPFEPARPAFEELVVTADSVVGLQMDSAVSSDRASVEDRIEARVVRDVRVDGEVAIPAGSRAVGSVMVVERGGKFKERARLGIRFHTLVLADGSRLPISTETIYRFGEAPGNKSAAKIGGGAVAGAILGAIIGGAKGAAVGATAGAGGGTAAVMAGDRSAATFARGAEVTARLIAPVTVTVEK